MNNPVVENTTAQINKTTIEPYHFITKKISKWSNAIKDQDYKFDIYKFGDYYVNNLGYQILRGRIDVRRFFNNDAFVVAFVIIAPRIQDKEKWEKTINKDDIIISVNNKIIDNKAVKIQHAEYTLDYRPDTLDTLFNFQKTSISRKPEGPIDVYSVVLTSQQLGIKFSELNSLIMQSSDNAEIWEVKKSDNKIFNYRVSAIDDKVKIKIPERYQFDFGELNNDTLSTDKFYINTEISLKKLSHKNLNHLATSKSWLEDDVHKYKGANELEDEYFWPHFWLSNYGTQFLKNSSLPDYGIKNFDGPVWSNLTTKSNINKKIQHNLYSGSEDVVEYYYNAPTRYDYSTKTIIDDSDSDTNGLFIPYSQAGEIKTSYNWFFKNKYNNNDADLIKVQILNKNLIDKPILDFVNGQISLSISDSPIEPKLLRYSLDTKQIETYIKMNPVDPSYFEKFRKIAKNTEKEAKNEEKNSNTIS
ncbi:hypothetical protein MCAL160_0958 [Mycoplasmopsis californica HAZ160_1]|uniref:DUF31 domain-containing protein n=1 Tax=Mycoplasmopsis californica HAZ160_1 TaxID=1397850 RepID=A0AAT9F8P8_9BACT|nr:hypothetical protein [Mycoplasmopsis californica]BAP01291.1 hypothetical protein MCAL160_0958 [Mycoplasmopsis californica HAZ160_1]BBG41165.1 hypothetical protein MCAL106_0958 [Mycoplasmopsis californica]BBG41758.1 hypothetical protein MCAL106E_0958 [Mycoplasmopsis californica]BBG42352.1 hypothetical protein MCAL106L_0958 [Mycoplasmopsis californica]BBG42927.1 hypothetical protein MCAL160E_0958 [Mycoplasmopsis californica]